MLPALNSRRSSLADVMPSLLAALSGTANPLGLPAVDRGVVLLVDGLGTHPLLARSGHARTLSALVSKSTTIDAGFPTTTASALATLTTGTAPGRHGLVGYSALDPANDRVVNQLRGWDDRMDPAVWQRRPTIFERSTEQGIPGFVVASERYRDSGFTGAVLRGAEYRSAATPAERLDVARSILDAHPRALVYVYVPELDMIAHRAGSESEEWTTALEDVDAAVLRFSSTLRAREGLLLTADHGMVDIPHHAHVLFGDDAALVDGIRFVAGEPRCLQLHVETDLSDARRTALLDAWRDAEGGRAWVASRAEAVAAGWFGDEVDAEVLPRIGDIIVAARKRIAYYDERADLRGRGMVGQHGSISPEETAIPLLRFGAFAA